MAETLEQRRMREHLPIRSVSHQFLKFLRDNPDIQSLYVTEQRETTLRIARAFTAGWHAAKGEETNG